MLTVYTYESFNLDYVLGEHRNAKPANLECNCCTPPTGSNKFHQKLTLLQNMHPVHKSSVPIEVEPPICIISHHKHTFLTLYISS